MIMAGIPYTIDDAKKLRDMNVIDDDTYAKIERKLSPEGAIEEESKLRQQLSNPTFAPTGSKDVNDEQIRAEALNRSLGQAQGLMADANRKAQAEAFRQKEIERMGGPKVTAPAPVEPAVAASAAQPVAYGPEAPPPVLATGDMGQQAPMQQQPVYDFGAMSNAIARPYDMQQAGLAEAVRVAEQKGIESAALLDAERKELERRQQIDQVAQQKRFEDLKTFNDQIVREAEDVSKETINPDRYWANKSTGDKILAGIGMALAGAGAGLTRTPNEAIKTIRDAISNDIEAQKGNIDQKTRGLTARRGIYNDMLALTKDMSAAEQAATIAYMNNAQLKVKALEARYQAPEMKAKAQQLIGGIEAEKNQAKLNLLATLQKQQPISGTGSFVQTVSNLPANMQQRAWEEMGKVQEWNKLTDTLVGTYEKAHKVGASGYIPTALGGKSETYDSWRAEIAGAIVGKVPGIKSDGDFERIVVPMLPRPQESAEAAKLKMAGFKRWLASQGPASPLLDQLGVTPKPISEKFNVNSGWSAGPKK